MMLSKKALRERCGVQAAAICALVALLVVFATSGTGLAAGKPKTVAELALYRGPDREKILIEGAKKEGELVFYTSNTWLNDAVAKKAFAEKYPFIKVLAWRGGSPKLLKRTLEEYRARRYTVDVYEDIITNVMILKTKGLFQEYYTPEIRYYEDEVMEKGKTGVYWLADKEVYISLGYNTQLVPAAETPKSLQDLLDPKWKGKIHLAGESVGTRFVGHCIQTMGREYLEKLRRQDVMVHNLSGAALASLIVAGEVPLCPTIYTSSVFTRKKKGGAIEWLPLKPSVIASDGYTGMLIKSPHPHAALLMLDYIHSKEGQEVAMQGGLKSPRTDLASSAEKFKKNYMGTKESLEEYQKKYNEWFKLLMTLFIQKK